MQTSEEPRKAIGQIFNEPMTVGELKKYIRNLPADTPVYLVTDKSSPEAWDEENEQWRYAVPLAFATRERNNPQDAFDFEGTEMVLLLEADY